MLESMTWIKNLDFSKATARDMDKELSQKTIQVLQEMADAVTSWSKRAKKWKDSFISKKAEQNVPGWGEFVKMIKDANTDSFKAVDFVNSPEDVSEGQAKEFLRDAASRFEKMKNASVAAGAIYKTIVTIENDDESSPCRRSLTIQDSVV